MSALGGLREGAGGLRRLAGFVRRSGSCGLLDSLFLKRCRFANGRCLFGGAGGKRWWWRERPAGCVDRLAGAGCPARRQPRLASAERGCAELRCLWRGPVQCGSTLRSGFALEWLRWGWREVSRSWKCRHVGRSWRTVPPSSVLAPDRGSVCWRVRLRSRRLTGAELVACSSEREASAELAGVRDRSGEWRQRRLREAFGVA